MGTGGETGKNKKFICELGNDITCVSTTTITTLVVTIWIERAMGKQTTLHSLGVFLDHLFYYFFFHFMCSTPFFFLWKTLDETLPFFPSPFFSVFHCVNWTG